MPKPEAPTKVQEAVQLRFVCWGDIQDKDVYDLMSKTFMEKQGNIKVQLEQYPGDYYEKIITNFAANDSADLVYWQGWMWQPYADQDLLIPVDEYIKRDSLQAAWPSVEALKLGAEWHGQNYMSSVDTGSMVIFYNKDLFDKAGVAYPTDDWTMADFYDKVTKTARTEGGTIYYGFSYQPWGAFGAGYFDSLHWIRGTGKMEWDQVSEPKKAQWDDPDIIDALQALICDLLKAKYAPDPSSLQGGGVTIATGLVAMCPQGPWFLPQVWGEQAKKGGGINYDIVLHPKGKTGRSEAYSGADGHTIVKACKYKDAAWEFMKYTISDDGQKIIAGGGRMPGRPETIQKFWEPIAKEKYHLNNVTAFNKALITGRFLVTGGAGCNETALTGANTPLAGAFDAMNGLQKTAKEALQEANPKTQKILDDYWAKRPK